MQSPKVRHASQLLYLISWDRSLTVPGFSLIQQQLLASKPRGFSYTLGLQAHIAKHDFSVEVGGLNLSLHDCTASTPVTESSSWALGPEAFHLVVMAWTRRFPLRLGYLNVRFPVDDVVWDGLEHVALQEEVHHWGQAWRVLSLILLPVLSLGFVLEVKVMSSQLSASWLLAATPPFHDGLLSL